MAIQIGAKPESDFNDPLGLLSDCHRRIERFLDQMLRITESAGGGRLSEAQRDALGTSLRYFLAAAPTHTADEEASLFPRLRAAGSDEADSALGRLKRLEADHVRASALHKDVDILFNLWLARGSLSDTDSGLLAELLRTLRSLYSEHILLEDNEVFPIAARVLGPDEIRVVGREMAERRGLDPDRLPGVSRCAERRLQRMPADRLAGARPL